MKTTHGRLAVLSLVWLGTVLLMAGCAEPASVKGMQAQGVAVPRPHPGSVMVQTVGGRKTNPLWTSEISGESFAQAIRDSITAAGVFHSVVMTGTGDYLLEVSLVNVDKPMAGFDLTVNITAHWQLTRMVPRQVVFQEVIPSSYTATVSDAFAAITRLRLAEEGAARANIQDGLNRLAQLKLPDESAVFPPTANLNNQNQPYNSKIK